MKFLRFLRFILSQRAGRTYFERGYHALLADTFPSPCDTSRLRKISGSYSRGQPLQGQSFDLIFPQGLQLEAEAAPILVFLHGGAWVASDKLDPLCVHETLVAQIALRLNVPTVNANYRLRRIHGRISIADQIADVQQLTAFLLHENVGGCRERGMILAGHSAGGHLILMSVFDPQFSHLSAVRGVYSLGGIYDFDGFYRMTHAFVRHFALKRFSLSKEERQKFSPTHAEVGTLPFPIRLLHGDREGFLTAHAQQFILKLQARLNRASLRILSGVDHFSLLGQTPETLALLLDDIEQFYRDCELKVIGARPRDEGAAPLE